MAEIRRESLRSNRSMPSSTIIPVLGYDDVPQAVAWLCHAFGFSERLIIGTHRAQLTFGSGSLVVTSRRDPSNEQDTPVGREVSHSLIVRVANADRHYDQALRAGARIVSPPASYEYGERQYSAVDIGGYSWTFSQTIVDIDPITWGGTLMVRDPSS
jgi:uncharacterized glyoxalase superfamily protein PhnB